ncbi:DNA primase/helicase [Gordonia phage CloverMinnie]|nr:DNA primase/helicase [Gordonia phage CloverMinnie]
MLGSTPLQAVFGSGVDSTDREAMRNYLRQASSAGLSLLFIQPGTKVPADPRTTRAVNAANKAAREEAQAAGRGDWQKVKAPAGLALASDDQKVLLKYLDQYLKDYPDQPVNLAAEVGGSRLIVVDCDTRAQVEKFLEIAEAPADLPPTVVTPGQRSPDGEWAHSDGGHFYFTVPEDVELPTNVGAFTWPGDDGFAVLWHRRYVLVPPSQREEGAYELVGREYPAPDWLIEKIIERGESRAARYEQADTAHGDDELTEKIDAWAEQNPWSSILEPLGWTVTARPDGCGCEVWTAPGLHASPKSATAHDPGCTLGRYTETNAPLHIWTDNPGEPLQTYVDTHDSKTLSKLQAVTWAEYDGNAGKAMEELDLLPDVEMDFDGESTRNLDGDDEDNSANLDEEMETPSSPSAEDSETPSSDDAEPETQPTETVATEVDGVVMLTEADIDAAPFPDEIEAEDGVYETGVQGVPKIAVFDYWRNTPPPEYIVAELIEHRGLSCIIGPPGTGKSTVALDMACHIATGKSWQGRKVLKTRVLYLPGEGLSGAVQRIAAWEQAHEANVGQDLLIGDSIISLTAKKEAWGALSGVISEQGIGLVIFDTFARMASGLEENSATDVGKAVKRFDEVRRFTNCGVLIVHHTAKGSSMGRGSSALNGALDSELLVTAGWTLDVDGEIPRGKQIELSTSKQKNAPMIEDPEPLLMVTWEPNDSVIVTGPGGSVDPLANDVVLASPIPEPVVETAIRIRKLADRFTQQGLTRSEIATQLRPDPYTARRDDAPRAWKAKVAEAVDRGLRYGLIETLTGTASGSRYIPSIGTIDDARTRAAAEVIGDDDDD